MPSASDIAIFCVVVDTGSFTKAAAILVLSKSAVSKYVSRLEDRLGVRLLNRTTRRISLTEAGEHFYQRASRILAALDEAEQLVSNYAQHPRGHLRISAPTFYGAEILSRYLGAFYRRYPDISMELMLTNRLVDLVEERFDAAIRISAPRDSSLVMRRLADIPIVACAAPEYLKHYGRPESPRQLNNHACLLYTLAARPGEWRFVAHDGSHYDVAVNGPFRSNDDHTLRQAALDGLGVLCMPKLFIQSAIEQNQLIQLWPDHMMPMVTLAVVYASRRELPAKVRAFVDFMIESYNTCKTKSG